jgi:type IV pilus assembly protein PilM
MATGFAWGIDVGNRALKAIKLVRENDQLKIDDFEVIEHEHVLSQAGDNKESLIQTAIANFISRHPMKGGAVAIGVSGQSSFARFIKLPPVEKKKIPEIVRFEAIQQIPFPLDDVEWSYQLFEDPNTPDVEVGIFAMRKDLVNRNIAYFKDVGMDVQVVQMNPLAVYNAVYYDQRIAGTTMVVDLGAENTDLIIAEGETVWLRSIPIGGNNFTEALVKQFKLNFDKAEDLKRNAATSKYAKQIFQAMRPIFADLVAEIQRSIGFYASTHRDSRISKVIALGGTFRLPGLQKYLQQNLQLPVERLDSVGAIMPTDAKLATTLNENILSTIGAYGLAVQAMGDAKIDSSLLPAAIKREKMWREKSKWFAAAAALVVLGTGGVNFGSWYFNNLAYESQSNLRTETKDILSRGEALSREWQSSIQDGGKEARDRLTNVQSVLPGRRTWERIVTNFYDVMPKEPAGAIEVGKAPATPRAQRNWLYIDGIRSNYILDLKKALAENESEFGAHAANMDAIGGLNPNAAGGMGGMGGDGGGFVAPTMNEDGTPVVASGDVKPTRGFLITMKATTPSAQGINLIQNQFLAALKSNFSEKNVSDSRRFYVARTLIVKQSQLKNLPGMAHPAPAQGNVQPGQEVFDPLQDPRTKENMDDDTQAILLIAVVIDPPPAPKPATGEQADAAK